MSHIPVLLHGRYVVLPVLQWVQNVLPILPGFLFSFIAIGFFCFPARIGHNLDTAMA